MHLRNYTYEWCVLYVQGGQGTSVETLNRDISKMTKKQRLAMVGVVWI